jgi:hypothetical protein
VAVSEEKRPLPLPYVTVSELKRLYIYKYNGHIYIHIYIYIYIYIYHSPWFELNARGPQDLRRRTEIIPVKDPHTRIKPLALASSHGRYITVTPERTLVSVGEWPLHI